MLALTDPAASMSLHLSLRDSACRLLTTVLGSGSDGYHEDHVHLDLASEKVDTVSVNGMCATFRNSRSDTDYVFTGRRF